MAAPSNISANVIDRPSIFELVAAQSLDSTFYPAFKKIALVTKYDLCKFINFVISSHFFFFLQTVFGYEKP